MSLKYNIYHGYWCVERNFIMCISFNTVTSFYHHCRQYCYPLPLIHYLSFDFDFFTLKPFLLNEIIFESSSFSLNSIIFVSSSVSGFESSLVSEFLLTELSLSNSEVPNRPFFLLFYFLLIIHVLCSLYYLSHPYSYIQNNEMLNKTFQSHHCKSYYQY